MSTVAAPAPPVSDRDRLVAWALAAAALVAGAFAGQLVVSGRGLAVLALAVAAVPVFLWKRPELAPSVLVVAALLVEQFDHFGGTGPGVGRVTSHLPLFHGLGFLPVNPADLLLCLLLAIVVARLGTGATHPLPRSATAKAICWLLAAVAFAVLLGVSRGGDLRMALMEARPYVYLGAAFVLASVLVTSRAAIRAVLWGVVLAAGFKAAQGLVIFLSVRTLTPRPEAVLGHEEALFFALFLLLTVALWLYQLPGRLRTTATLLAPVVLAADLANARRAAWLVLAVGFVTLAVVAAATLPHRRRFLVRAVVAMALVLAVYLPAYWNGTGGFAQPARAIRSAVAPTARDQSSNLYRVQEDANLLFNIREAGPLGKGFGVRINYALPIVDLTESNPFIAFVPHNGVFYVPMRMGVGGAIAFWSVIGLGILSACRLARSRERELAVVGALAASALVAYTFEGKVDQGFFFYRIAFVVGTIAGVVHAARLLDRSRADGASEDVAAPLAPSGEAA